MILGRRAGFRDDGIDACTYKSLFRVAAGGFHLSFERGVVALGLRQAVIGDEDALGPAGGEFLAAARLAGLDQDGMALGAARHGEWAAGLEEFPLVVEAVDFFGVGEQAGFAVGDDGAVLPGVPVAHDDFQELIGAVVAGVVLAVGQMAHVEGFAVVHGGDDVPGGAAVGEEVERGEDAGDVERFEVCGGEGGAEAEAFGGHAHDREDGDGVHFDASYAVGDGMGVVAAEQVGHCQPVVEEAEVEFSGFEGPADAAIILGGGEVLHCLGVAPGADEVGAVLRLQESDQGHLAHCVGFPAAMFVDCIPGGVEGEICGAARGRGNRIRK